MTKHNPTMARVPKIRGIAAPAEATKLGADSVDATVIFNAVHHVPQIAMDATANTAGAAFLGHACRDADGFTLTQPLTIRVFRKP